MLLAVVTVPMVVVSVTLVLINVASKVTKRIIPKNRAVITANTI